MNFTAWGRFGIAVQKVKLRLDQGGILKVAEVTINHSIEGLLAAIVQLDVSQKHQLWKYLDSELFEDDDSLDEQLSADVEAAYADYAAGDYLTIQEYRSQRTQNARDA